MLSGIIYIYKNYSGHFKSSNIKKRFLGKHPIPLLFILLFFSCNQSGKQHVDAGFYYWKTNYKLNATKIKSLRI